MVIIKSAVATRANQRRGVTDRFRGSRGNDALHQKCGAFFWSLLVKLWPSPVYSVLGE
jgi:hypothetical protein